MTSSLFYPSPNMMVSEDTDTEGGSETNDSRQIGWSSLKKKKYDQKGAERFLENTLGIHFEKPYNWKSPLSFTLDDHGQIYFFSMLIVSLAAIYNFVTIPLRFAFFNIYLNSTNSTLETGYVLLYDSPAFYIADIFCDLIYLADIFLCQSRIQFISKSDGNKIEVLSETVKRYVKTFSFLVDVVSILVPFVHEFQYFFTKLSHPLFRVLRIVKMLRVIQFGSLIERKFSFAQTFRQFKVLLQIVLLSNLFGSLYFAYFILQKQEKIGIFASFDPEKDIKAHPILFSFYWGFVIITNIHNQSRPKGSYQYMFMIICHLMGALNMAYVYAVFVSSLRIKHWQRNQFRVKTVRARQIFHISKIPPTDPSQQKAAEYFAYGYDNQIHVFEKQILAYFPRKLSLNVFKESYFEILKKPEIFKKMSYSFFNYLIPRLENRYYLPGEYIYQYRETAKEMFIVTKGGVELREYVGSRREEMSTTIEQGESFGFKELFGGGFTGVEGFDVRLRTGDAITEGFVHCLVILKRDLEMIIKTYVSEDDNQQMKENMESVKRKLIIENLKHGRDRKLSRADVFNTEDLIETSLLQALQMIQVLLIMRDNMRRYSKTHDDESEDESESESEVVEGSLSELLYPEPTARPSLPTILEPLQSIREDPHEISPRLAPVRKRRLLQKQHTHISSCLIDESTV